MAEGRLPWRTVWITGASSGIGLELARAMDGRVNAVAISARSADTLRDIALASASIRDVPLDVSDETAVSSTVAEIEEKYGPIDLAVLNAGVWHLTEPGKIDVAAIRQAIEVNFLGTVNCLGALVPRMVERGAGHIAVTASVAGYRGLPRAMAYGPTKAALINLVEGLRSELEPLGITVSVINPGFVDTPLTRDNPFPMPAMMESDEAALRMLDGLVKKRYEIIFPRRFVYAMKLLRILPNAAFFALIRRFVHPGKTRSTSQSGENT